jgi:hypothetical protein
MTTALILSEMPIHDDALVADIDAEFAQMNRDRIAARQRAEDEALILDVDWLVSELLDDVTVRIAREALEISLELTLEAASEAASDDTDNRDEVAEVA